MRMPRVPVVIQLPWSPRVSLVTTKREFSYFPTRC